MTSDDVVSFRRSHGVTIKSPHCVRFRGDRCYLTDGSERGMMLFDAFWGISSVGPPVHRAFATCLHSS